MCSVKIKRTNISFLDQYEEQENTWNENQQKY